MNIALTLLGVTLLLFGLIGLGFLSWSMGDVYWLAIITGVILIIQQLIAIRITQRRP